MPVLEYSVIVGAVMPRYIVFQDRPAATGDAAHNWDKSGIADAPRRGWTKHHQVPWSKLRIVLNEAVWKVQRDKNSDVFDEVCKCAYKDGHAGSHQTSLKAAVKQLGTISNWTFPAPAPANGAGVLAAPWGLEQSQIDALEDFATFFCWMPGNIFLGPTPGSRTDDPGEDGYDAPPRQAGGQLSLILAGLYKSLEAAPVQWPKVRTDLQKMADLKIYTHATNINQNNDDWHMTLAGHVNSFKKKLK
jgi:hypothetical protein